MLAGIAFVSLLALLALLTGIAFVSLLTLLALLAGIAFVSFFSLLALLAGGAVLAVLTDDNAEILGRAVRIRDDKLSGIVDGGGRYAALSATRKSERERDHEQKRHHDRHQLCHKTSDLTMHFVVSL